MNDFLNQFLIECREIIEQASETLLRLERTPQDAELLDGVFRAFHTLKGSAGIVEFAAMENAVHQVENVLVAVRSGQSAVTTAVVGECLACLDQVGEWLDVIERTGVLPIIQAPSVAPADWVETLLADKAPLRSRATTAIRYIPDPECFFAGEDPLDRAASLPALLALHVAPASPWPALEAFDPYRCNLIITALTAANPDSAALHLKGATGDVVIVPLHTLENAGENAQLEDRARAVLEAQLALLDQTPPHLLAGCVGSAGLVAANVLRHGGHPDATQQLARATQHSLAENSTRPLCDAIAQLLASPRSTGSGTAQAASKAEAPAPTVRIAASRIDGLVRVASELSVAKNALGYLAKQARADGNPLAMALQTQQGILEHLVGEVQTAVLGLRVQPLRSVFQRFPRVVREVAAGLGKPIRFEMSGEDTEADKAIVEMLFEPLLHLVRNSIDHGVESAATRAQRGKSPEALIQLQARRQGDRVLIEVSDDGGGVDVARIREVARERVIMSEERLRSLTDEEIIDLIFAPGFSTANVVTALSGRGVGMDAVRSAVQRVGGHVSIASEPDAGTTVKVLLPFGVLMTRIMTVEAGGQHYGIPLDAVTETVRVARTSISGIGAGRAIVLRDRTLPVVDLADMLGMQSCDGTEHEATLVVVATGGLLGGIRVDRIGERMEVILRPLDGLLAGTPGITGTTLIGNGEVLLVLDIGAMLQ